MKCKAWLALKFGKNAKGNIDLLLKDQKQEQEGKCCSTTEWGRRSHNAGQGNC